MHKVFQKSIAAAAAFVAIAAPTFVMAGEINVYSYRQPFLMQPLIDQFQKDTGIIVNTVYAKRGLIEKVKAAKGKNIADLILTSDISNLVKAANEGIAEKVNSDILNANIPAGFRDPDGKWFGLTARTRVIYASKVRVSQDKITYEELVDPKWKGRICIRSGQNKYNLGLFASIIANKGEAEAQKWLEGLKANLAHAPKGNDRAQAKSIFNGECDLAIANAYYMGKMETNEKNPEQKEWANSLKLLFPNIDDRGTSMNISGVVIIKDAPNKANAIKFVEFLSSDSSQEFYAKTNFERPVKPSVKVSDRVAGWGEVKVDTLPLSEIAKHHKRASELVDIVGFDK